MGEFETKTSLARTAPFVIVALPVIGMIGFTASMVALIGAIEVGLTG